MIRYPTFKNGADLDIPSINDNESLPSKHVVLHDGDLVIADTAEDYTAGKAIELYNTTNQNILSGLHTIPCRPKLPFAPGYLGYYFNSVAMKRKQHPLIQGIKVYSLSRESLMSLSISYPSIREQNKIASLLLRIDERIEVQNKIICSIESLIKGISNHYFQNIKCKWINLKTLRENDVIQLKRGNVIPKHCKDTKYCYPVYSSSIVNNGLLGYSNSYMFDSELVSWSIDGGGNFFYRDKHKFSITNVSGYIVLKETFDYRFVYECLSFQFKKFNFDYQTKAHPSVIETLYSLPDISIHDQLVLVHIMKPFYEKAKIEASFLKQLKKQKQFLLSNLFI
ncbi:MAG: restriction endonuclease subunit S [Bacilli bacterium]|nr:restriction endonuclease subunit S [Bacilli bacterium]MCH4235393.1 restriction endonuclease subunit S [Bacilli bacterium]